MLVTTGGSSIVNTGSNTQAVGLDAVAYLDNGGKGMVELEKDAYRVNEDTKCPCKEFLNSQELGECHCGLYIKVEV